MPIDDFGLGMKACRIPTKLACVPLSIELINGQFTVNQLYTSIKAVKFKNSLSIGMFEVSLA